MSWFDEILGMKDDDDCGPDDGEYGLWSDCPENMPADNDFAD